MSERSAVSVALKKVCGRFRTTGAGAGPGQGRSRDQGAEDIVVFVGGVIPAQDYDFLYKAGMPGSSAQHPISACAKQVLAAIKAARVYA